MSGIRGVFQLVRTVAREVRREGIQGFLSRMSALRNTPALPESNNTETPPQEKLKDAFTRLKQRLESTEATFKKLKKEGFSPTTFGPSTSGASSSSSASSPLVDIDGDAPSSSSIETPRPAFMHMTGRNATIERQVLVAMISVQEHAAAAADALNAGPKGDSRSYRKEVVNDAQKTAESVIRANKGLSKAIEKGEQEGVDTTSLKDSLAKGETKLSALLEFITIVESRDAALEIFDLHHAQNKADALKSEKSALRLEQMAKQAVKLSNELGVQADELREQARALKAEGEDKKAGKLNQEAAGLEARRMALTTFAELVTIQSIALRASLADDELD